MPLIVRTYIKTALVYLVVSLLVAMIMGFVPQLAPLRPVYIHLLIVGWITQLIMGVALWMFPKYSREQPRGSETLAWETYALLNMGLVLRAIGEPLLLVQPGYVASGMLALSSVLQLLAGWSFVYNTWDRVKGR